MTIRRCCSFAFWLGLLLLLQGHVVADQPVQATGLQLIEQEPQSFADTVHYFRDTGGQLSFADVLARRDIAWKPARSAALNLGILSDVLWVKLDLPAIDAVAPRLFEVANHKITDLTLYVVRYPAGQPELETTFTVSDRMTVRERPYHNRNFVFPVELRPDTPTSIYLRVYNQFPMKLPLFLWSETQFRSQVEARALFQGTYFGVVIIMAIYNLSIYLFVRDKSYGTYTLFILCLAGYVLVDRGLAMEYLWPDHPGIDFQMTLVFTALGCASTVPFTVNFLSLRQHAPQFARAFNYLFGLWLLIALVAIIHPAIWLLFVVVLVLIPGGSSLFVVGVLMWKRGVPAAPYYTIAWAVLVAAATFYDSYLLGLLPVSIFTEYSLQAGSMIEVTLLSIGLAYRIKTLDAEKREARLITEAKSEFLATMSHEIRTPMNGILGMAELMRDTQLSQRQQAYLDTILNSGQTLLTVLNDILDFSKIEAGKLELEFVPFNVRTLVDETAAIFAVKAKEKKLHYNLYIAPDVPARMSGDSIRVRQVLSNLISNAFKFTREGSVSVRVSLVAEQHRLLVEVIDSGIGIAESKADRIFEKFTQADSSTSRQYGGTGLGLAISRRFIELMGGNIGVRSKPGQGSTFWFTLPLQPEDVAIEMMPAAVPAEQPKRPLLLISPTPELVAHLQSYLPGWGLELQVQASLQAASINAGAAQRPGFILIDQHCSDFSAGRVRALLSQLGGATGSQLILLLEIGSPRAEFEILQPTPWIEEYPLSIDRLKRHFRPPEPPLERSLQPNVETQDFSRLRVLVVDDNDVNAMVVSGFLRKLGIQPEVVKSGRDAIDLICDQACRFDLILMDCEMPEIDGYEATARIREWEKLHDARRQSICALSAHALQSYRDKCLQAGMDDFLSKPILFDQLKTKLGQYLGQQKM